MNCLRSCTGPVSFQGILEVSPIRSDRCVTYQTGSYTVEARALGRGGISAVSRATGLSRTTVRSGLRELGEDGTVTPSASIRQPGGGRKSLEARDPDLVDALQRKLDPVTRGDPQSTLRWTCRSAAPLAAELRAEGHTVSERSANRLLHSLGYSLQANRKTLEGRQHPDRDAQFQHISRRVAEFQSTGQPVVSVDAKKKELISPFRNGGREWCPQGDPEPVRVYDFVDKELGKVTPYGVYDIPANRGWMSVGVDHDTAEFAVESLRRRWREMGRVACLAARRLLVTADGGGSNSSRSRLWKLELQGLADELGLEISVSHFPGGTSRWNKIEHRMFSHVTQNWRGRPLVSRAVVVNLIGAVTTGGGGLGDPRGIGRGQLRDRAQDHRRANGEFGDRPGDVPRGVELHSQAKVKKWIDY